MHLCRSLKRRSHPPQKGRSPRIRLPRQIRGEFYAGVPLHIAGWMFPAFFLGLAPAVLRLAQLHQRMMAVTLHRQGRVLWRGSLSV